MRDRRVAVSGTCRGDECGAYHARDTISGATGWFNPLGVACFSLLTFARRGRRRDAVERETQTSARRPAPLRASDRDTPAVTALARDLPLRAASILGGKRHARPRPAQRTREPHPIKARTRIVLSRRRDMLVADHRFDGVAPRQRAQQRNQLRILRGLEAIAFETFELDADRVVVAVAAVAPLRRAGVPGTSVTRNELQQLALAADHKVSRHLQAANRFEIRMCAPIEAIGEQALDRVIAVVTRW